MDNDNFKKLLKRFTDRNTYISIGSHMRDDIRWLYLSMASGILSAVEQIQDIFRNIPDWPIREKAYRPVFRYGFVIVLCIIAIILKEAISPLFTHEPVFLLFYAVIVLSSWYGGTRPGIFSILLSSIFVYTLFLHPLNPNAFLGNMLGILFFMLEGTLIVGVNFVMHKTLQTYEEKKRYSQYYASIARHISDAVISTDMNLRIQSWNDGAEVLYGWKAPEVIGQSLDDIIPHTYQMSIKKSIQEFLRQEGSWKGEVVHKRKNGSRISVLTSMSLLHGEDGKALGIVSVHRDISDRKKLEQGKDDFIALASHELKTPLTSVKLYTGILKQRFEKASDKHSLDYLSKIDEQMGKLLELVNYLLDVSKVQTGKIQFHMEEVPIDPFVKDVVKDIQQINTTHRFVIEGRTDRLVCIDRDRFRQVIVNTLNNAVKYSEHSDRVFVRLSAEGSFVRISVQDFGIGIPKEKQEKIFERFYQVTDVKGYTFSGMGLGLYISRGIIEKHNGRLYVESEEGRGSTFHITLPTVKKTSHEKKKDHPYH